MRVAYFIITMLFIKLCLLNAAVAFENLPADGIAFNDVSGNNYITRDIFAKPTLVFFQGHGCPISDRQLIKIDQMAKSYAGKLNVLRIELNPDKSDAPSALPYSQILVHDRFNVLARYLKPQTMTESFLISENKILYRGALDNQFTLFGAREENIQNYLQDAVEQKLNSQAIVLPQTTPYGCIVNYKNKSSKISYKDFERQVVPIIEKKCQNCHAGRSGLDFSNYETLSKFRDMIGFLVKNNIMPPWAAEGSNWKNDLRLSPQEKKVIQRWVNSDDEDLEKRKSEILIRSPQKKQAVNTTPNYDVIEIPVEKTTIEARQPNGYRYFKFSLNNDEPMWIDFIQLKSKIDFQLHHAVIVVRNVEFENASEGFTSKGSQLNIGTTLVWKYYDFDKNRNEGFYIPKKAWFYIQAHYEGSEKDQAEQLVVILRKFKKKPKYGRFSVALMVPHNQIKIPPNTKDYLVEKKHLLELDENVSLIAVNAHMHSRGDKVLFQLKKNGSGKKVDILKINRYFYKFQMAYFFKKPLLINKGDELQFSAWYDNTNANLNNIDSDSYVNGGLTSKDEMGVGTALFSGRSDFVEKLMTNYFSK